jgi:hypothetical protein
MFSSLRLHGEESPLSPAYSPVFTLAYLCLCAFPEINLGILILLATKLKRTTVLSKLEIDFHVFIPQRTGIVSVSLLFALLWLHWDLNSEPCAS